MSSSVMARGERSKRARLRRQRLGQSRYPRTATVAQQGSPCEDRRVRKGEGLSMCQIHLAAAASDAVGEIRARG